MRVMPNMCVISPCDAIEAFKATIATLNWPTPVYIRLAREKTPIITTANTPFAIGKAQILWESSTNPSLGSKASKLEACIVVCGALVHRALLAAKELEGKGVGSIVVNLATIKPFDAETIISCAKKTGAVVTVEEHQIAGGMGSAVAECLAQNCPVPIEFIGVQNKFGQSGTMDELIAHYKMDVPDIIEAVQKVISRKG